MTINSTTLRPGLLVSLSTRLTGNVDYSKKVVEALHLDSEGKQLERWETLRVVTDPEELERAKKARGKASSLIRGVCALSAFGLLCPEDKAGKLESAIAEARAVADEFNTESKLSRLNVYVITGRIAADDVEALRAINSEVRGLLEDMAAGVQQMKPDAIREAANKAKSLGSMLTPDAAARVQAAIEVARQAARQIVKAGETASATVDSIAVSRITEARVAFLDWDEAGDIAAPTPAGRALDLEPEADKRARVAADMATVATLAAGDQGRGIPDDATPADYEDDGPPKAQLIAAPIQARMFDW